ncbi:glycerophosphocholine phosphodiesterase GPCPD1 [Protopterus annectens]|uniref:glycerophosphocholine phosphodiesterase GPCPD1 n=1 Tax=Protopterus annectens TaxID=7888 RepID=UPI001CF955EC|nr:glycerophosphocholine phosphodiesterase GPCPD1 [Protopterus annectens]
MSAAMASSRVTFKIKGTTVSGEFFGICGSSEALGLWYPEKAAFLQPDRNDCTLWTTTVILPRSVPVQYRYFRAHILKSKNTAGSCQVIVNKWETHQQPRSLNPSEPDCTVEDGQFGIHNDIEMVDSGWLTCQTEIRLRLHYSEKAPVSISKKKFKNSRFRMKLMVEGLENDDGDDDDVSHTAYPVMTSLEIIILSNEECLLRHSQPECGYAIQPERWTEYCIRTMEPDNLEIIFDFFEEELSEAVIQGDVLPGHVGTACLLSSTVMESGKSNGMITLPIMSRNSRQALGKVRVDYLVIKPIKDFTCNMKASYCKYWKPRMTVDVGHRGSGNSTTAKLAKLRENTVASLKDAASHGAAYVEFDVHLSKDLVPVVYHDLTCCISMKKKLDMDDLELFEVPVKDFTFEQLQLLKLAHVTALKTKNHKVYAEEEDYNSDNQPFPSLQNVLEVLPEHVGYNIEIKWPAQQRDGVWEGNLSSYFDMNLFTDIILKCVLENGGQRRILFSSFEGDVCTMFRQKQNKYPVLFLSQGYSEIYPELMDIRTRTTPIAIHFAHCEHLLGISAHTEDLLRSLDYIAEAKSKGLVVFCWGDDTNDPENRRKLRECKVDGLIYDSICESLPEQPDIFMVEQMERLKKELPEDTLRSCCSLTKFCHLCNSSRNNLNENISENAKEACSTESDSGLSSVST